MTKLKEISERVEPRMNVQKLATKFPQYFMYDRVKQLVSIKSSIKVPRARQNPD
jgi:hypothetical protein